VVVEWVVIIAIACMHAVSEIEKNRERVSFAMTSWAEVVLIHHEVFTFKIQG
jgi:hypothetical protein